MGLRGLFGRLFKRQPLPPLEAARLATRDLRHDNKTRRRVPKRGGGSHFGKTPIKKYGDEHHEETASASADGGFDSGGGGGGSD